MMSDNQIQREHSSFESNDLKKFIFEMIITSNNLLRAYKETQIAYEACLSGIESISNVLLFINQQGRLGDFYLTQLEIFNKVQSDSNLTVLTKDFLEKGNIYAVNIFFPAEKVNDEQRNEIIFQARLNRDFAYNAVNSIKESLLNSFKNIHEIREHDNVQTNIRTRLTSYNERFKNYADYFLKSLLVLNAGGMTAVLTFINSLPAGGMFFIARKSLISFAIGTCASLLLMLFMFFAIIFTNRPFIKAVVRHNARIITTQELQEKVKQSDVCKEKLGWMLILLFLIPLVAFIWGIIEAYQLI